MINHPDHREDMNILYDCRELIISSDLSFSALSELYQRVLQIYSGKANTCRSAIVVGDAKTYAKAHQFVVAGGLEQALVKHEAFRDIVKAVTWLGLPEDYEIADNGPKVTP